MHQSIEYYEINCSGGSGIEGKYQFQGKIEDKAWYLDGFGELFPFDFYTLAFELYPYYLEYEVNETRYGLPFWNYTFVEEKPYVYFYGLHRSRLVDAWEIYPVFDDGAYDVYLFRKEEMHSFQFIFPLVLIQTLIAFSPSFTNDKSLRIRLYSSILLFSPMFIFAIQNFIPYRSTLSIPEFLSINLIFFSTSMIFASLIDLKNERSRLLMDMAGVLFPFVFYWWLKDAVYRDVGNFLLLPHIKPWFDLASIVFLAGVLFRLAVSHKAILSLFYTSKEKTNNVEKETKENSRTGYMLSKNYYLLVLVVIFTVVALLIWLLLIPYGIIEYNLGVNLFTSSIFMVITVVFLSWLFDLREKLHWKIVEQKVYSRIALNLRSIITLITFFIEMKEMKKMKRKMQSSDLRDIMIARLEDLNEKDSITIDEKGRSTLLDKSCKIDLEIRRRDLSEIETKYSRFFMHACMRQYNN